MGRDGGEKEGWVDTDHRTDIPAGPLVVDASDVRDAAQKVFDAIRELLHGHSDAVLPLVEQPTPMEQYVSVSVAAAAIRTLAMASGRTEDEITRALADGYGDVRA
jgi:hypothetical protein